MGDWPELAAVERIVAEREKKAAVQALRDAADEWPGRYGLPEHGETDWLRARADRLAGSEQELH